MPACMACSATGVSAAPSKGSSTIASTLSLMNVSTWLICVLTSLVPSATCRSMSSYLSASLRAASVMPAIQPWSAAGAEKPIVTLSPVSSLLLAALLPPPEDSLSGVLLVQPVIRAPAAIRPTAVGIRRRKRRCRAADMPSPRMDRGPPPRGRPVCSQRAGRPAGWCRSGGGRRGRRRGTAGGEPARSARGTGPAGPALAAGQLLLEEHGEHDDHAASDGLGGAGQIVQREDVAERGEDQDAQDGADDRAAAADQERAADDDGGDGVELVEDAMGGAAGRRPGHEHHRSDAARDAGQHVEQHGVPLDADPGQAG